MDRFETRAYRWLISQGYKEDDIIFRFHGTPDFITKDGKGWEVKTMKYKTGNIQSITFSGNQIYVLMEAVNTYILVYKYHDKDDVYDYSNDLEPISIIDTNKLKNNKFVDNILVCTYDVPDRVKILLDKVVVNELLEIKNDNENYSGLIHRLIHNGIKLK